MLVDKNINVVCKSLEELIDLVKKLEKRKSVKNFNFSGNYIRAVNTASEGNAEVKHFSVSWTEEEEI